jgi:tetratricopeptide (TPR) repeat protein
LVSLLNQVGKIYDDRSRWPEAEPLYLEALAICRELFGSSANNDLATRLNNLANLYKSQGRWTEAEPLYLEALAIRRELFGSSVNNDLV